ncbi:MAG: galactose-1-phosphate uridylyltransferase [Armatimonadota bacterium]
MSEFRQNLATKEWIIIAAERARRPEEFTRSRPKMPELAPWDAGCPFCPGNERMTPDPIWTLPLEEDHWDVRVVPNKFPALQTKPDGDCRACTMTDGPYLKREGVGSHEVVIETPLHNQDLPELSLAHMQHVVDCYRERYNALNRVPSTELVVIFRNHGTRAGTSLIHPHSQIIASSVVPFPVRNRLYEGQRYFDSLDHCVYCDILDYERKAGTRVVTENEHFLAFTPYASSVPYEVWLLPKHHRATFGTVEGDEVADLASSLHDLLARLWRLLDDPDYNYVINTAPEHLAQVPFYHWHLAIYPRLTTPAGFEIGSGIGINILPPEAAAEQLRGMDGSRVVEPEPAGG